ncbi:MAG TPA: Rrf2 family transcriptional regulator [Phycisphaerae bacterium]|nr:Rrf2 family transcriptional regulator [Phycisphaerae bacterium]HRY69688.1 Rrf2 family transcriptional regulator [Phycisphaerae bacterium]HSA25115.1 Rrf2 family transcriptional regulator [Phycisphaerae bacterium]
MLSFTRKTDYALISLAHIARSQGNYCSAREIATHYGMPIPLLMNILKVLSQHGITRSIRGPRGGYQLAKPPKDVTLHDIIVAVDGPVALTHCLEKMVYDQAHAHDRSTGPSLDSSCREASVSADQDPGVGCKDDSHVRGDGARPQLEDCCLKQVCPVRGQVHRVHHKLVAFLQEVTLADIVEKAVWRDGVANLAGGDGTAATGFSEATSEGVSKHEVAHLPG